MRFKLLLGGAFGVASCNLKLKLSFKLPAGRPWGTFRGPGSAFRGPRGTPGHQLLPTGALRKSSVLLYKWLPLGSLRASWATIRGNVLDQRWPPKTSRRQRGRPRQREDDGREPKGAREPPEGTQGIPQELFGEPLPPPRPPQRQLKTQFEFEVAT